MDCMTLTCSRSNAVVLGTCHVPESRGGGGGLRRRRGGVQVVVTGDSAGPQLCQVAPPTEQGVCAEQGQDTNPWEVGGGGRGQEGTGEGAVSVGSRLQPVPAREEAASSRSQRRSTEVQLATEITPVVPSIKCLVPRCFAHITYK